MKKIVAPNITAALLSRNRVQGRSGTIKLGDCVMIGYDSIGVAAPRIFRQASVYSAYLAW